MNITQVYEFANAATQEAIGGSVLLNEDLSNIVDIGEAVFNANAMDRYVKALVNRIGKTIFVNRVYTGSAPSVMMDGWEYGSVLQKVSAGLPKATVNETWELVDGQSYDPHIFHKPEGVTAKFYNNYVTFEIDMSFTEDQLKASFNNATELNAFISMLYTNVDNSMTIKVDELIRRTINNMIINTLNADGMNSSPETKSGVKAINLLKLYNDRADVDIALTADNAIYDAEFIRFASYMIKLYYGRIRSMSTLFNIGQQPRFTPGDLAKIVMLEDFASAADVYLQSDTFHNELTKLPQAETVPYWQGSGTDFSFESVSTVKGTANGEGGAIDQSGIICCMFDRWALGVSNVQRKVTSQYTPNAEFFTNFYKYKAGFFNDLNENFVVFFIA